MRYLRLIRLFRIRNSLLTACRLMRSPRVPTHLKVVALGLALLVLSPLNVLGDIPLLGIFDDVALLSILAGWFVRAATPYAAVVMIEGVLASARTEVVMQEARGLFRPR